MRGIKAGFVGFGEINTPRDIIEKKCLEAKRLLEEINFDLVHTEPVSDDPEGIDVARAIKELSNQSFDLLVVCIAGWIPTHAVISVISEFKHKPMLLWGLAGYREAGRLVTTADQAGTTALRSVMEDMGYNFKFIYNCIDTKPNTDKILSFAKAARAKELLSHSKVGMMGYRDMNLYGTMFDGISLRSKLGVEVEFFEMLEMVQKIENLKVEDINKLVKDIMDSWGFQKQPKTETLEKGAQYYLAIKEKIQERKYGAVSLIDVDGMKKLAKFPPSMVFMLLADKLNICTVPENDTLGAVTQLIIKYLTEQIGAYMEFYEFMEDRVLIGVPDYVPAEVVDGKVKVCPTSFGSFSEGILNVSKVKTGRVTLCRLIGKGDKYRMHIVTGEAITPGPWEEAGWTPPAPQLPSLEVILDSNIEEFADKVASQHYIVSYGDNTVVLKDFCKLLGIDVI